MREGGEIGEGKSQEGYTERQHGGREDTRRECDTTEEPSHQLPAHVRESGRRV